jgi:hypothetical protein
MYLSVVVPAECTKDMRRSEFMKKWAACMASAAALLLVLGCASASYADIEKETFYVPKLPRGAVGTPAATIQGAVDLAKEGDEIIVVSGIQAGATIANKKNLTIRGLLKNGRRSATIGFSRKVPVPAVQTDVGPLTAGFILLPGSEGTTIQDLKFRGLALPVYGAGASEVTIENCEIAKPVQGITVWDGSGWLIQDNIIKDLMTKGGGGLGIVIGSRDAEAGKNEIVQNKVYGRISIQRTDVGRFIAAGLALIADVGANQNPGLLLVPDVHGTQSTSNIIDVTARPAESRTTQDPYLCGVMLNQLGDDDPMSGCFIRDNGFFATNFGKTKYHKLEKPDGIENCNNIFEDGLKTLNAEEEAPVARNALSVRPF